MRGFPFGAETWSNGVKGITCPFVFAHHRRITPQMVMDVLCGTLGKLEKTVLAWFARLLRIFWAWAFAMHQDSYFNFSLSMAFLPSFFTDGLYHRLQVPCGSSE